MDESGFEQCVKRQSGWSIRGERIHDKKVGNWRKQRINLIAAKQGKDLLAPMLIQGNVDASVFNTWLEYLFKTLKEATIIIMDNASFHKTQQTNTLFKKSPHTLLYLPPYSPDLNPIEKLFAHLKKRLEFEKNSNLDNIIQSYGS